jgi:peptidoglycan biosynthesis protein MviN/MurJ (putative lipid II flippase)
VGNGIGFLFPFAVARHFGVGRTTDAYAFAFAVATFGIAVMGGVVEANILPAAQEAKRLGRDRFASFIAKTARQAAVRAIAFVAFALAAGLYVAARGDWTAGQRGLAVSLIGELIVLVILVAANSAYSGALYALDAFFSATASAACRTGTALVLLAAIGTGSGAMQLLCGFLVAGEAVRGLILRRIFRRRIAPLTACGGSDPDPRIWNFAAPHAINMIVLSLNPVVDRMAAATLAAGSVTLLDLGERVYYVPVVALTSSVILVSGARWSALSTIGSPAALRSDYVATLRRVAILCVVVSGAAILATLAVGERVAAHPVGERAHSLIHVTAVLLAALPFSMMAALGGRFLIATRRTGRLPLFAAAIVITNSSLDFVGAHIAGIVGIAGATVVAQAIAATCFTLYCLRLEVAPLRTPAAVDIVGAR